MKKVTEIDTKKSQNILGGQCYSDRSCNTCNCYQCSSCFANDDKSNQSDSREDNRNYNSYVGVHNANV